MDKARAHKKSARVATIATGITTVVTYVIFRLYGETIPPEVRFVADGAIAWVCMYTAELIRQHRKHGWKR